MDFFFPKNFQDSWPGYLCKTVVNFTNMTPGSKLGLLYNLLLKANLPAMNDVMKLLKLSLFGSNRRIQFLIQLL